MANGPENRERPTLLDWLGLSAEPDFRRARWLGGLVSLLIALLIGLALVAAGAVLVHTIRQSGDAANAGPNLGAGALIAALLGAPLVVWATWLRHRALSFQKEGHITDRINKAVEMLGAEKVVKVPGKDADGRDITVERTEPNIEVRLGAILSLERIAQDSTAYDRGRDHVRVMEILCAYVRENAPAEGLEDHPFGEWEPLKDNPTPEERAAHEEMRKERFGDLPSDSKVGAWAKGLPTPRRPDVVLALKVIGRRTARQRVVEAAWPDPPTRETVWPFDIPCPALPDEPGEASETALTPAEVEAYRRKLDAWKKRVGQYRGYELDLRETNLRRHNLSAMTLSGANLRGTRMEGARLWEARMEGADLWEARMEGADLWEARMEGADLREARMDGVNLWEARMEGADLWKARMEGADLWGARMEGAKSLTAAVLRGAAVRDVSLLDVPIGKEQIAEMFGDASVTLPERLTKPDHWPDWKLPTDLEDPNNFHTQWRLWRSNPAAYSPPPPPP
ncbi:MAG: pentapeptide repeat-containing protein [Rhodobacteraceae bacterium]|nr:pentapeptide repeat-containing protein [Paracoccaceae bacterium]